jgi:hypothetical protein
MWKLWASILAKIAVIRGIAVAKLPQIWNVFQPLGESLWKSWVVDLAREGRMRLVAVIALMVLLAGCSNTRSAGSAMAGGGAPVVGDEKGGKIPDGVANSANAYGAATNHCKNYGKKAFITKWDSPTDRGAIVFECK